MRKIKYYCDNCKKDLEENEHISVNFDHNSGWVRPDSKGGDWHHFNLIFGIHQFCNIKCLGLYFTKLKKKK